MRLDDGFYVALIQLVEAHDGVHVFHLLLHIHVIEVHRLEIFDIWLDFLSYVFVDHELLHAQNFCIFLI